jgi:2,3-dihydroxyphenylpropionate 1,2-dioxygenase
VSLYAICASHTPLKDHHSPGGEVQQAVDACFARLRAEVAAYAPELVIVFGPDHFNGFFHRLMPAFCVGAQAVSIGDWNTPTGPLPTDPALAERLARHLFERDVDVAVSHRMEVDHGLTQTLAMLMDWAALPPVLPIFVNCVGAPRPPLKRVLALGRAVGEFAAALGRRVLLVGSGGLSHDPPVPALAGAPPEVRERLINGGALPGDARAARQARVIEEGLKQAAGQSDCTPLNPAWDRQFLERLVSRDLKALGAYTDDELTRDAGRGGHEVRCWLAVAAAMAAVGAPPPRVELYLPVPVWVAGFGVLSQGPG